MTPLFLGFGANSLLGQKAMQALPLPASLATSPLPLTELLSVPLMDPTISYLAPSHRFFPLQRKISLSSPFSAYTMDLIVEKERERQVEVNEIKVFYLFLSNYSSAFSRLKDVGNVRLPGVSCLKSCGWKLSSQSSSVPRCVP